jgi:adenylate cyclase
MCERAVALDPDFADAWVTIGRAKERLRFETGLKSESGEAAIARALRLNDKLASAHAAIATIANRNGDMEGAERALARAFELDPEDPDVVLTRASTCFRQQRYREALAWYEKSAALDPLTVQAPGMGVTCAKSLGDKEALNRVAHLCLSRCEAVLAHSPDSVYAMAWLVPSLIALGQLDRIRYWVNRALMFDPDNFSMRYNFACALSDAGDFEAAMDMLDGIKGNFSRDSLQWMKTDPDLVALRTHPRYEALIAELDSKLGAG